jgi:hypothetical protein
MSGRRSVSDEIDFALRRHFSAVFAEGERAALVAVIREWDEAHSGLDRADRLQAWLAIARAAHGQSLVS